MTNKTKKTLSIALKIIIVMITFWLVHSKLTTNNDLKDFLKLINKLPITEIFFVLGIVFLLMFLNWYLESLKWQFLLKKIEVISIWRSIESVFCGLTLAIFTPNRIGEFGGRVFFLTPKRRIIGIVAMGVGNMGQLVLKVVFGAISVCIFVFRFTPINTLLFTALCILALLFISLFLIFYFNIKWVNGILLAMKFTRKYKKFYAVLARYKKAELFRVLLMCLARYLVFSTQYLIIFSWLIPELRIVDVFLLFNLMFFVQSFLPSIDLLDIGVKSITAVFFFQYITQKNTVVIASIASIWLINIIIPAILGSYFVFKLKFFGSSQRT